MSDLAQAVAARRAAEGLGISSSRITLHGGEMGNHLLFVRSGSNNEGVWEQEQVKFITDGRCDHDAVPLRYGDSMVEQVLLIDCTYVIEVITETTPHGEPVGFDGAKVHIWDGVDAQKLITTLGHLMTASSPGAWSRLFSFPERSPA